MSNKNKIDNRSTNSIKPNKYLQPFAHQQWKILERSAENRDKDLQLRRRVSGISVFVYSFSKSFFGVFGILMLLLLLVLSSILPFTTQNPELTNTSNKYQQVFSNEHILGTDHLGRDVWARLWHGMSFSFKLAFMATLIDVIIGVSIGLLMGKYKKFDIIMQWIIKVLSNVPSILIMILATLIFQPSFWVLVLSMTFTGWISMSNHVRSQVIRAKKFLWVTASRVLGTKQIKIIFNFIPVIIPIFITQLVFSIPGSILSETSLAFIGLSIPGAPTLGNMIADGSLLITLFPRFTLIPSFMLIIITTSIQFIGNATQDALRRQR